MTREGGKYIKDKDGSVTRVEWTRQPGEQQPAPKPAPKVKKREVNDEDA
jgi:hypothetical protein